MFASIEVTSVEAVIMILCVTVLSGAAGFFIGRMGNRVDTVYESTWRYIVLYTSPSDYPKPHIWRFRDNPAEIVTFCEQTGPARCRIYTIDMVQEVTVNEMRLRANLLSAPGS